MNFGMSGTHSTSYPRFNDSDVGFYAAGFQTIDLNSLVFPAAMYIDYVRVYQREDAPKIGCSPDDYPTADYINKCGLWFFSSVLGS